MAAVSASLEGRRAFVTGAAKGIGAAIARRLAGDGAGTILADRDGDALERLCADLGSAPVVLDVTDTAEVEQTIAAHGPFDILINNAGIDQHAFHTRTDADEWQRLLSVNLVSVLATVHAVLPAMQDAGYGRIVNIASEAGRLGSRGGAVYAAAKGGVIAFTKSIALENARFGITANCIAPGPIDTPLVSEAVARGGEKLLHAMTGATLLGRLGTPEEVADAAAFLVSGRSGFITGETLCVSGGMGLAS